MHNILCIIIEIDINFIILCSFLFVFKVAKQWHDHDRAEYHFVNLLQSLPEPIVLRHMSDFDENGIFYWIGSNARYINCVCSHCIIYG